MRLLLFLALASLFPLVPVFVLVYFLSGTRYPLTNLEIFWFSISFSQLPRKCTNLPASGTVGMFKLQNNFFTNWFAHDKSPISISVEFLLTKVAVLVTGVFELHDVEAVAPSSWTRIITSLLEGNVLTPRWSLLSRWERGGGGSISKRACYHVAAERRWASVL